MLALTLILCDFRCSYFWMKPGERSMSFECEILSESKSDLGGIKETVLSISARSFGGMMGIGGGDGGDDDADEDFKSSVGPYGL